MKSILFLLFSLILLRPVNAVEFLDRLKTQFPEGLYVGINPTNKKLHCYVSIKHSNIQEDWKARSEFEISIFDETRQNKSIYRLGTMMIGGRGDCPNILIDKANHLKVKNDGMAFPCFSRADRINHGGFEFIKYGEDQWRFSILNPKLEILQSCLFIK
jgi:hypothetical protein